MSPQREISRTYFMAQREIESDKWRIRFLVEDTTSLNRRFFRSPKGYIGVADSRSRHTDIIAVLFGASVPLILRRIGEHYKVVGDSYLHGFMCGEAIQMMKYGKLEVETFSII
jgi:hypothetical protein